MKMQHHVMMRPCVHHDLKLKFLRACSNIVPVENHNKKTFFPNCWWIENETHGEFIWRPIFQSSSYIATSSIPFISEKPYCSSYNGMPMHFLLSSSKNSCMLKLIKFHFPMWSTLKKKKIHVTILIKSTLASITSYFLLLSPLTM